jgi:hypothetical protein
VPTDHRDPAQAGCRLFDGCVWPARPGDRAAVTHQHDVTVGCVTHAGATIRGRSRHGADAGDNLLGHGGLGAHGRGGQPIIGAPAMAARPTSMRRRSAWAEPRHRAASASIKGRMRSRNRASGDG